MIGNVVKVLNLEMIGKMPQQNVSHLPNCNYMLYSLQRIRIRQYWRKLWKESERNVFGRITSK